MSKVTLTSNSTGTLAVNEFVVGESIVSYKPCYLSTGVSASSEPGRLYQQSFGATAYPIFWPLGDVELTPGDTVRLPVTLTPSLQKVQVDPSASGGPFNFGSKLMLSHANFFAVPFGGDLTPPNNVLLGIAFSNRGEQTFEAGDFIDFLFSPAVASPITGES